MTFIVVVVTALIGLSISGANNAAAWVYFAALVALAIIIGIAFTVIRFLKLEGQRRNLRLLSLSNVDQMSGLEFEEYVAELFRAQGHKIQMTPTNDYGVDIILQKDGIRTAVQTKRYSKPVNQAAVREVVAGMLRYKCSKCMVATNNTFTKSAIELANSNYCKLIDRDRLAQLVAQTQTQAAPVRPV